MGKRTNTAKWIEKSRRWQINVQKDGQRKTFTSATPGRTGQREANAKADAWLDEGIVSGQKILSKIFPEYLEALKLRTGKSHWKKVEQRWKTWEEPVLGRVKPDALSDQKLQAVVDRAFARGHLSKETLRNIRKDIIAFAKFLRKAKYGTYRPEEVMIPQGSRAGKRKILQPDDLVTLFSIDTTTYKGETVRDEYINAYRFQVLTGLRPGELMGIMRNDIADGKITIRRSINIYGEITDGKNENAERSFFLSGLAQKVLDEQLQCAGGLYVFGIRNAQHYRQRWYHYCEVNGITKVTPYELRHTFVSAVQSLPEGWVKALVGHSQAMDTFGIYAHEVNGQQSQIAAGVEGIFRDILSAVK